MRDLLSTLSTMRLEPGKCTCHSCVPLLLQGCGVSMTRLHRRSVLNTGFHSMEVLAALPAAQATMAFREAFSWRLAVLMLGSAADCRAWMAASRCACSTAATAAMGTQYVSPSRSGYAASRVPFLNTGAVEPALLPLCLELPCPLSSLAVLDRAFSMRGEEDVVVQALHWAMEDSSCSASGAERGTATSSASGLKPPCLNTSARCACRRDRASRARLVLPGPPRPPGRLPPPLGGRGTLPDFCPLPESSLATHSSASLM